VTTAHDDQQLETTLELSQYSAAETLRDGRPIRIRALHPEDREAMGRTVRGLSEETIYRRLFSPRQHMSEQEIAYYMNVDFVSHVALVAVFAENGQETIVAGGRYVVTQPDTAEVAFVVSDTFQGQGIGGLLMKHLTDIGRRSGIKTFVAEVLAGNAAMLKVFEKSGLAVSTRREHGVLHVTLAIK